MIKYKINMQEKDILVIPAKASFFGRKLAFELLELELDFLQLVFMSPRTIWYQISHLAETRLI